jgi:RNA polymerase sigma-70 factor (family 1)
VPIGSLHNEADLLQRVAAGDEQAFTALVDHYWNKIYTVALVFTKSPDNAKDIVQEVFLRVWAKRTTLTAIQKFDAWLFIVARNEILNALRKKGPVLPIGDWLAEQPGEQTASPEETLHLRQLQDLIRKGIDLLPPQQKLIYKMSREQGLSHEEICQELGLARSTVKNTLVKALGFLRTYIQEHEKVFLITISLLLDRF